MTKKKIVKQDFCTFADIFPWLRMEKLTDKEYEKRQKKREAMEKKHPRLKAKAVFHTANSHGVDEHKKICYVTTPHQYFIDVSEADPKQKKALTKWLTRKTCPLIPGVEFACYIHDYARFREAFIDGRVAEIND